MARTGHDDLKGLRRGVAKLRLAAARALIGTQEFSDEVRTYRVRCRTLRELWRVHNVFRKEEGTIELISREVGKGDVFCDVGANIGLYTLLAAARVGDEGCVYAFEPAAANFSSLLENLVLSEMTARVVALSIALTDEEGVFPFHYSSLDPAFSGSQLHDAIDDNEERFAPIVTELKAGASLDSLIESGQVRPPTVVKIDVDGNEPRVLRGMQRLLSGPQRPRVLSVEANQREKDDLFGVMENAGYAFAERNFSEGATSRIKKGADPESLPYNAIFRPA